MRTPPTNPTLEQIVAEAGGPEKYFNSKAQRELNNGLGYDEIMLLFKESVAAVTRQTGRNKKTVYKWIPILGVESNG